MLGNLADWKEIGSGIYRHAAESEDETGCWYEIHVTQWMVGTDVLTAYADLFSCVEWVGRDGALRFERMCIGSDLTVARCLCRAEEYDFE